MAEPIKITIPPTGNMFGQSNNGLSNTTIPNWSAVVPTNNVSTMVITPGVPASTNQKPSSEIKQPATENNTGGSGNQTQVKGTPVNTNSTPLKDKLDKAIETNPLNDYYQPMYHFRLFATKDEDLIEQAKQLNGQNPLSMLSKLPQITVAETGITGFNITDVDILTIAAGNRLTTQTDATHITISVVEPLGVSFLDGLYGAAKLLNVANYTKMPYYLELTFTGYNLDGTYAGRPMKILSSSKYGGGTWIWSINITDIDMQVNEGMAQYKLECVVFKSIIFSKADNNPGLLLKTMTIEGNTVEEMYKDLVEKYNQQWIDHFGGKTGVQVIEYAPIVTHKVEIGPPTAVGKDPGKFKLIPESPDKSAIRSLQFGGGKEGQKITCQVPEGTVITEVLISIIKNTEEFQKLAKDVQEVTKVDDSSKKTNDRGVRESTLFNVDIDPQLVGFDVTRNNYRWLMHLHVVPQMARVILSKTQVDQSQEPQSQQNELERLVDNGFVRRKYEYMFTGKNTEVISMDMSWKFNWQALISGVDGTRMNMNTESLNARMNPGNYPVSPTGSRNEATDLVVKNLSSPSNVTNQTSTVPGISNGQPVATNPGGITFVPPGTTTLPSLTDLGPNNNPVAQSTGSILSKAPSNSSLFDISSQLSNTNASTVPVGTPNQPKLQNTSGTTTPQIKGNVYIEDITDAVNQNKQVALPVSLWSGYRNTKNETGVGLSGQYHRGLSVLGAVFDQINVLPLMTGDNNYQNIELNIKGDPLWLGQTNVYRQDLMRRNKPLFDKDALPDNISGDQLIYVTFRYPQQIGDDFAPVLEDSPVMSGFYFVKSVKHTFSEGTFKQTLSCIRDVLLNPKIALSNNLGNNSANGSNSGLNQGNTIPASGSTPQSSVNGLSLTPTSNGIGQVSPTPIQKNDPTAIGNLSADQTASLKAALGKKESQNNPLQGNNGVGNIGQYQMGQSALVDAGYVTQGVGSDNQPSSWTWTGKNGVNSVNDFLNSPNAQNGAMNDFTTSNYNTLVNKGIFTSLTPPPVVAGLLGAAHISGAGGAYKFANGLANPSDNNGETAQSYYNIGYNSISR